MTSLNKGFNELCGDESAEGNTPDEVDLLCRDIYQQVVWTSVGIWHQYIDLERRRSLYSDVHTIQIPKYVVSAMSVCLIILYFDKQINFIKGSRHQG